METPNYSKANCVNYPEIDFFPERGHDMMRQAALSVCRACVIREDCLEANLGEKTGVWGATTEKQRREIRSQRRHLRLLDN